MIDTIFIAASRLTIEKDPFRLLHNFSSFSIVAPKRNNFVDDFQIQVNGVVQILR
jgi:hypothetical protein